MHLEEREYDEFPEDHFPNMAPLRVFRDCRVWTAGLEQPLIVLAEDRSRRLAVFEYESLEEREPDCQRIRRMPDEDSDPDCGITAPIQPAPHAPSSNLAAPPTQARLAGSGVTEFIRFQPTGWLTAAHPKRQPPTK